MAVRFTPLEDDDPKKVAGYKLQARLGSGGMGRVYLAFSPGGRALAIKVVRPDYAQDPEFRRRFKKEIRAAQSVQGLYTAPVVDADSEAKLPWLATAYVPGPSLQQAVSEHGPLPLPTVFRLLAGVAEGLTAVHTCELIHRDLKPANILLADDGPRVIDFGIAHAAGATTATSTEVRIGTPAYMAPEQVRGRSATPATDVFALGNLAVYAATGHAAFGEGNSDALFFRILNEEPDLDDCLPKLRTIVQRCLAKDPGERPAVSEIMEYARRQTEGETLGLAGSWLPEALVTSLAGYDTAKYRKTATPVPPPKPKAPAGQGSSGGSVLGWLVGIAVVVVLVIGPGKVLAWVKSDGTPPVTSTDAGSRYTPPASDTDTDTGSDTGSDTVAEPTEKKTPDGCERGFRVIGNNSDTYDKASSASLSALASNLDAAADAAGDSEVEAAIRDLADDSRAMSDANSKFQAAIDAHDLTASEGYSDAFSSAFGEWKDDAETLKSLCS